MIEYIVFGICFLIFVLILLSLAFVGTARLVREWRRRQHVHVHPHSYSHGCCEPPPPPPPTCPPPPPTCPPAGGPTYVGQVYEIPPHERGTGRHRSVWNLVTDKLRYDQEQRADQFWRDEQQLQAHIAEQVLQAAHTHRAAPPYTPPTLPTSYLPKA